MTEKERSWLRRNLQANSISQFTHGEQGALIATAKIVATVPDMNAKFYAATQVMDEARHVEAYKRLLHEKFELAYPINPALKTLLEQTLSDRRWDMTYLGMQVLIEGLALAAFQAIRDKSGNTLAGAVNAYVMQDEARHVLIWPPGAARLLSATLPRPSATSARNSWSKRSISCATASISRKSGSGSACRPRCWTRSTTIPSR